MTQGPADRMTSEVHAASQPAERPRKRERSCFYQTGVLEGLRNRVSDDVGSLVWLFVRSENSKGPDLIGSVEYWRRGCFSVREMLDVVLC